MTRDETQTVAVAVPESDEPHPFPDAREWLSRLDTNQTVRLVVDPDELLMGINSYEGSLSEVEQTEEGTRYTVRGYDTFDSASISADSVEKEVAYRFWIEDSEREVLDQIRVERRIGGEWEARPWEQIGYLVGGGVMEMFVASQEDR